MGKKSQVCAYAKQAVFRCIRAKDHDGDCAGYLPNDSIWAKR